jgi:tripartite motif-containing protein 71
MLLQQIIQVGESMASNSSTSNFQCPNCGAALTPEPNAAQMKCPYCGDTVIIPQELRSFTSSPAPSTFNSMGSFQTYTPASTSFSGSTYTASPNRAPAFIFGGIIALLVICVIAGSIGYFVLGFNPFGSLLFANKVMSFGSEGIGQGMFQDARAIGVDGSGNTVVADYEDGRVQIFDPNGKFKSLFTVKDKNGKPAIVESLAASRDGKIYIAASGLISIYDENGQNLGAIGDLNHYYQDVALGADGTLYGYTEDESIVRFKSDGSVDLEIPNAVSSVTSSQGGFTYLAVDGSGDMYLTNDDAYVVLKYSPAGKFVSQFGGESKNPGQFTPGKFISPLDIAVDGYGRIYVSDFFNVQVFDADGKYLNNVSGSYYGMAFDSQNNLYGTSTNEHNVVKFQIQKPAGSTAVLSSTPATSIHIVIPTATPDFASTTLTFGSKGIGQGMLSDARAITVDSNGNIILADYNDGRVQVFDSTGKFVSLISLGQNVNVVSLAAGSDGKLYVPFGGNISIMDETGKVQKVIKGNNSTRYYTHVALGSDGTLYAFTAESSIVHFDKNYKITQEISNVFVSITNRGETIPYFAVDGSGNMYVLGEDNLLVLKYSSAGKYISQFGGSANSSQGTGGQFQVPSGIAVDSYGRIYVTDLATGLLIFDSSGAYLNTINVSGYGLAIDSQNNVYVTTGDQVEKFQVQKPSGQ